MGPIVTPSMRVGVCFRRLAGVSGNMCRELFRTCLLWYQFSAFVTSKQLEERLILQKGCRALARWSFVQQVARAFVRLRSGLHRGRMRGCSFRRCVCQCLLCFGCHPGVNL